jgi:RNA polymerase sigma-70 factor (ECF subfamily)
MRAWLDALVEERPELADAENRLVELVGEARAAWPTLTVDAVGFIRHLARRLPMPAGDLADLPAADLYLAYACAAGDPAAIAAFEARYFPGVHVALAGIGATELADEVKQVLRARFFVGDGSRPPAIAEYAGRGDLHGWVKVSALREGLRVFRGRKRATALEDALMEALPPPANPEAALLKAECRGDVADALRAAIAALPAGDRALLRYQLTDGLGLDGLAAVYGVHRATIARRLARLRAHLIADTHHRLATRLHLGADEVRSLIRMARSQLDVSLGSLLDERSAP